MLSRSPSPARCPAGVIEPCLPTLAHTVPSGPQWVHEIKHDGFRFICRRAGDRVRVFSRRGNDYTERVPTIVKALRSLPVKSVTLDGEGVVCDANGVSDFELLRAELGRNGSRVPFLYAFDVLELDGRDLRAGPWHERRTALTSLLAARDTERGIQHSEHADVVDGATLFQHACAMGSKAASLSVATEPSLWAL
jgi:bifunctional non-homologous end joining protein LigD